MSNSKVKSRHLSLTNKLEVEVFWQRKNGNFPKGEQTRKLRELHANTYVLSLLKSV